MKVKSKSEVAQSCLTLCGPVDHSPPGFSVRGIFQARVYQCKSLGADIRGVNHQKLLYEYYLEIHMYLAPITTW